MCLKTKTKLKRINKSRSWFEKYLLDKLLAKILKKTEKKQVIFKVGEKDIATEIAELFFLIKKNIIAKHAIKFEP